MRGRKRELRTLLGATAAALLAFVLPVSGAKETPKAASDDEPVPVTIHVSAPSAPRPDTTTAAADIESEEVVAAAGRGLDGGAPEDASREAATDDLPPGVVRVWHVMYAQPDASPRPASADPCPRASTCEAHQLRSGRWPADDTGRFVIPFAYNDSGRRPARAPDGITQPALRAAMNEWARWNPMIGFRDEGATTATFGADGPDGTCADGTNVVTWEKFGPEVIGAAVLCFDASGSVIRDADLALNATQHWERVGAEARSRHAHDIQSILTHEIGHWLSLEDLYSSQASAQTMHGSTRYGETSKRTLALGDIIGLQKAYPCSGGVGCPREGIADD